MQSFRTEFIKLRPDNTEIHITDHEDLLLEILARLPVKSLLRFKSVSKRWLSLISSPDFCLRIFHDPYLVSGLLVSFPGVHPHFEFISLTDKPQNSPFRSPNFVADPSGVSIFQSCHGLLLGCSFRVYRLRYRNCHVFNPVTKHFATLPEPEYDSTTQQLLESDDQILGFSLAFDPAISPHYKVISVRCLNSMLDHHHIDDTYYFYQIEIYSSETRSWRLAGDPFLAHVNVLFKFGVFCNNAVHWISAWGQSLYFDIGEEQAREMPMPPLPEGWEERRYVYFGSNRNHLHLVEIYSPPTTQFDVYEMKSDYSEWFVKYRVDLSNIVAAFPEVVRIHHDPSNLNYHTFNILCIIREAKDEDSYMVLHIPGKIITYSFKDKSFRKISDFAPDYVNEDHNRIHGSGFRFRWFEVFQFVESFSCV